MRYEWTREWTGQCFLSIFFKELLLVLMLRLCEELCNMLEVCLPSQHVDEQSFSILLCPQLSDGTPSIEPSQDFHRIAAASSSVKAQSSNRHPLDT